MISAVWTRLRRARARCPGCPGSVSPCRPVEPNVRVSTHPALALPGSLRRAGLPVGQPRIARGVGAGVIGVEVDEAALDQEVADFEHVAPSTGAPLGHARAPGAVLVLAEAGP